VIAGVAEDDRLWRKMIGDLPILRRLTSAERVRLRTLTRRFLAAKRLETTGGIELNTVLVARVAAQACLPILGLDLSWYADWSTLVIVPDRFTADFAEIDEAGVVHEWNEDASGESWDEGGPIVLSYVDIEEAGSGEGYNVIIHELAHKIDALDGSVNGRPPLHANMDAGTWTQAFTNAYSAFCKAPDDYDLDPYAAKAPEEFFAVASEYFFELPDTLAAEHPSVYTQLATFYRQDPQRLSA